MNKPEIPYHLHTPETDLPVDFDEPCAHPDCGHARREHRFTIFGNDLHTGTVCAKCDPPSEHDFIQGVTRQ